MTERAFRFTHAIVRTPGRSSVDGLRAVDRGAPDHALFLDQHAAYAAALREAGVTVITLPVLEAFPDSAFVEDAALCLPQGAVALRPGAPSRLGEAAAIRPDLARLYADLRRIYGPGFIEGGDILTTEREILVGRSARTDAAGIAALTATVADWGWTVREVATPPGVLHFKTDCALLDAETVLATPRLAASGCFDGYRVIHTAGGEDAAANVIRVNDMVLAPDGYPATRAALEASGYAVRAVPASEAAKLDAGMSCLSLRCAPPAR